MNVRQRFRFLPAQKKDHPVVKKWVANDPQHNILVNSKFLPLLREETKQYRHVGLHGSSQSGKSDFMPLLMLLFALEEECNQLYMRKEFSTIHLSQWSDFVKVIYRHKWRGKYFDWNGNDEKAKIIYCLINKSKIIPLGLDNSQKITSISGIKRIWVEEPISRTAAKSGVISFDDFIELDSRAREKNAQIYLTYNPISKASWIYENFFHPEKANKEFLSSFLAHHSTFHDNAFVDAEALDAKYKAYGKNYHRIYALGQWGMVRPDTPWWYAFNLDTMQVPHIEFRPHMPIYWRVDFNLDVMATSMAQTWPLGGAKQYKGIFDELPPVVGIPDRIESIKSHPLWRYKANSIFITDSANPRNIHNPNVTLVSALYNGLALQDHQLVKGTTNPAHVNSSTISNKVLQFHTCEVAEKCQHTITDFVETRRKPDGSIDKKHHDPHYGDGDRYFDWWIMRELTPF